MSTITKGFGVGTGLDAGDDGSARKRRRAGAASENGGVRPRAGRLVLHFDINKTIIITDPAAGATMEQMVSSLLSECAWGRITRHPPTGPQDWELVSDSPSPSAPSAPAGVAPEALVTFHDFVELVLKMKGSAKKNVKFAFVDAALRRPDWAWPGGYSGAPGAALRPHYERLLEALAIPASDRAACAQVLPRQLGGGQVFLLPAFFELLRHLAEEGRDYSLVFRTFGHDLEAVVEEFNTYCEGRHPLHAAAPRLDGSDGGADRRVRLPDGSGAFVRDGGDPRKGGGIHAALVSQETRLVQLHHGLGPAFTGIEAATSGGATLALGDHYNWWASNGEADDAGKPLCASSALLGTDESARDAAMVASLAGSDCVHIMFDDNIERDRAHIVDVRDRHTGEPLPFAQTIGRVLVKAEPFHAITARTYFIEALQQCEARLFGTGCATP